MSLQITEAFNDLLREKRIDKSILMETLAAGFKSAVKKKFGATAEVDIEEDEKGMLLVYVLKQVVKEVTDSAIEMSLEEALEYSEEVEVGDELRIHVPFSEFGRNAIQIAKQILMQKIREFERERTFEDYKDRTGEIVSGSVQQIDRNGILVNLGNAEATMPKKEQIRRERYSQGSSIRACIVKVDKEAKGPMVVLSRTSADFLKKLFAQEVPEIYEEIIDIKSVAREAGGRSKVAVYSRDDRVDAVGACVGMKGSRVQAVVNELSGERIDIVPWSEDISAFVNRALSPARIASVRVNSEERSVLVVVEDDQLSLAIGKDGQNVRLASKLTGWQIDLITAREIEQRERLQEHLTMGIEEMVGVTVRLAELLRSAGITTVQRFAKTSPEELLEVPGLGPKTLTKLRETAEGTMEELDRALQEMITKENAELAKKKEQEKPLFDESILNGDDDDGKGTSPATLTEEALFGSGETTPEESTEADGTASEESTEADGAAAEESTEADGTASEESAEADGAAAEESTEADGTAPEESTEADGTASEESAEADGTAPEESNEADGAASEESIEADGTAPEESTEAEEKSEI